MDRITRGLVALVALLHGLFFVVEFFLWETVSPLLKLYDPQLAAHEAPELAALTVSLGRNCGLYNGIIAGALILILVDRNLSFRSARTLTTYLLVCIIIAGIYGGVMLLRTIPIVQALPALVALVFLWRKQVDQKEILG